MKTITEFAPINLKNAAKTQQELQASGKAPEEMPQALGEALKLEGDRLTFLTNALEATNGKFDDLKRVLVVSLNEGEKAPSGATQKGDHFYIVEYYPPIAKKGAKGPEMRGPGKGGRDRKGGRRGKGRGGDRGGDRRGGREGSGKPASPAPKKP